MAGKWTDTKYFNSTYLANRYYSPGRCMNIEEEWQELRSLDGCSGSFGLVTVRYLPL